MTGERQTVILDKAATVVTATNSVKRAGELSTLSSVSRQSLLDQRRICWTIWVAPGPERPHAKCNASWSCIYRQHTVL